TEPPPPRAPCWCAPAPACSGSQAPSPAEGWSFLPSPPPAALMSATANSPPFFICAPKEAYWPVIGPTMATGVVSSPSPPPQPASVTAAKAMSSPVSLCIVTSLVHLAHNLHHTDKAQPPALGSSSGRAR